MSETVAGESFRAYNDIITINLLLYWYLENNFFKQNCYVIFCPGWLFGSQFIQMTCRVMGIGDYLVRQRQRIIQVEFYLPRHPHMDWDPQRGTEGR